MSDRPIELRTKLALEEARSKDLRQDRDKARVEAALAFGKKPTLSPADKFHRIKPTGSRDGFGP
jgi:hypothetical protein